MSLKTIYLYFFCLFFQYLQAQNITVGTLINSPESEDGYTLFSPMGNTSTFLINNCGQLINQWTSSYTAALGAYLHSDGSLYRSGRINNANMNISGLGGRIERFDWNGNLTWGYNYYGQDYAPHHDFCVLPNGNVILIVAERKTRAEIIAAGRDSIVFDSSYTNLLTEYLVELEPIGIDSARIVWEWHTWDHIVQDFDSTKQNYGNPAAQPELIDINFTDFPEITDWMHSNAVYYNANTDQLVLSNRHLSEIWIIDHSTTTAEAASNQGGLRGKGGDLLYRWGNPEAYRAGTNANQVFDAQHSARFTENNQLLVYNNAPNRGYSSIDIIDLPIDSLGNFPTLTQGASFAPNQLYRTYIIDTLLSSGRLSGVQMLPSGNLLIASGVIGYLFEVNTLDSVVWAYKSPVGPNGIATQGIITVGGANDLFNCTRYLSSFSGFNGQSLNPGNPIELNYDISHCQLYNGVNEIEINPIIKIFPNPANQELFIETDLTLKQVEIYDILGKKLKSMAVSSNQISVSDLSEGLYILIINGHISQRFSISR